MSGSMTDSGVECFRFFNLPVAELALGAHFHSLCACVHAGREVAEMDGATSLGQGVLVSF